MEKHKDNVYLSQLDTFLKLPRKVQEDMWQDLKGGNINPRKLDFAYDFDAYESCESPIEIIFAYYFDKWKLNNLDENSESIYLEPQYDFNEDGKRYRLDFLIEYIKMEGDTVEDVKEYSSTVVVECDGHQFHEKTKEQVKRGNQRDYDLKMCGYDVIHFSGSELYNNPQECVQKVVDYLRKTKTVYQWEDN